MDDLRPVLIDYSVASIIPSAHDQLKGLRTLRHEVETFAYMADRVLASRLDNIADETQRENAMAQQASDLDITINNMLPAVRATNSLVEAIKSLIAAQEAAAAATTTNGTTSP
jgi:hypothetical protein